MDFSHLLDRTAEVFFIVPLAVASVRKSNITFPLRLVYYFLISILIIYILRRVAAIALHNNIFSYHPFTAAELFFISETYIHLLPSRTTRLGIRIGQFIFIPLAIADATLFGGLTVRINTFANTYAGTMLVALAILHLFSLLDSNSESLRRNPYFIFSVATLFNSAITTLIHATTYFSDFTEESLFHKLLEVFPFINGVYMGLLAAVFLSFRLSVDPRNALPRWLRFTTRRGPVQRALIFVA